MENEIKGLEMGAVDYIRKPVHMETLRARVDVYAKLLEAQKVLGKKL